MELAKQIKEARKRKALNQKELAGLIGVNEARVRQWEKGVTPSTKYCILLSRVLDININGNVLTAKNVNVSADRMKKCRLGNGYTQRALAKELGVSNTAVAFWENGMCIPRIKSLSKMAKLFNVSNEWLLGMEESTAYEVKENNIKEQSEEKVDLLEDVVEEAGRFVKDVCPKVEEACAIENTGKTDFDCNEDVPYRLINIHGAVYVPDVTRDRCSWYASYRIDHTGVNHLVGGCVSCVGSTVLEALGKLAECVKMDVEKGLAELDEGVLRYVKEGV